MMDFDELDTSCNADFIVHRAHEHYSTQALRLMQELRQAHKLCDIRLQVGGQVIVGHRVVLAAFSRYFYAMFTGDMLEASQSEVVMKQVDARSVEMLVEYAYTGNLFLADILMIIHL